MDKHMGTERMFLFEPNINIVMRVVISRSPEIAALERAIEVAIRANEILNCKIILSNTGIAGYERMESPFLSIKLSEKSWIELAREEESNVFNFTEGELIRFFILTGGDDVQLLVIAHHLAGDGMAIIHLVRDIMTALSQEKLEYKPLQTISAVDLPKRSRLNPLMRLFLKGFNFQWSRTGKPFSYDDYLRMFRDYWSKHQTVILHESIDGDQWEAIRSSAKEYGVTINSLITTCFAQAYAKEADIGIAVNVRGENHCGMGNFASGISVLYRYDESHSLSQNARNMHKAIYGKLGNDKRKYLVLHFISTLEPTLLDATCMVAFVGYRNRVAESLTRLMGYSGNPKDLSITNIGKINIPHDYGEYGIKNIAFAAPIIPNAKRVIALVTLGESLSVTMHIVNDKTLNLESRLFLNAMETLRSLKDDVEEGHNEK